MQYHAIPCNIMQYHGTLITADGAYHCPVGSIMAIFVIIIIIIIPTSRGLWDISDCFLGPWPSYYSLDENLDSLFPRGVFLPPQYCGVGTGQHMYINAFEGLDVSIKDPNPRLQDDRMIFQQVQATIDITIGSASAEGRKWSIRSP